MPRHRLTVQLGVILAGAAISTALTWWWLATWIPTGGKAWLERTLERQWPIEASIGAMQYAPWRGLTIHQVRVSHKPSQELWFSSAAVRVQVGWLSLVVGRLAFHARSSMEVPWAAELALSGRFHLRTKSLTLDLRSSDAPIATVGGPLRLYLPSGVEGGTFRVKLRITQGPARPPVITGQVTGSRLTWRHQDLRLTGNLSLDGDVTPGQARDEPWIFTVLARLQHGVLEGLPAISRVTQLSATVHVLNDRMEIAEASGLAAGSVWKLEGTVAPLTHPQLEALVTSEADLAPLAAALLPSGAGWQMTGRADIRAVCRGTLGPQPLLDYLASAELRDATVTGQRLPYPVTGLSGRVAYDGVTRQLTVDPLRARVGDEPLYVVATATLGDLPHVSAQGAVGHGRFTVAARLTPEDFVIDEGRVTLDHSEFDVIGRLSRTEARESTLRAAGAFDLSDLALVPWLEVPWLASWHPQGVATGEVRFQGRLKEWTGALMRGRVFADRLTIRDVPLEQCAWELEQRNRTLRVRVATALIAGGRFRAEATVEHAPTPVYFLQGDVTDVQLARLAAAIPAWRTHTIIGTASGHVMLSGPWQERSAWRGEGWVHASGERLGDMPLLDKVFRSLFGVLADRLGLDVLRRAQITEASVRWQLGQERFRTDDLRLGGVAGTQPVAVYATGSVGMDRTLDFVIEPEFTEQLVLEAPNISSLASYALKAAGQLDRFRRLIGRHRLTGTLKDPKYHFEFSPGEALKQATPGPADLLQGILDSLR